MKSIPFVLALLLLCGLPLHAQQPLPVQRPGYYLQQTLSAQLDSSDSWEEVRLYGRDNGHWPEFDLFVQYIAIVSPQRGEVLYLGDPVVTDHFQMHLADPDGDGIADVTYNYIRKDSFRVGDTGYFPRWTVGTDTVRLGDPPPVHDHIHWADSLRQLSCRDPRILPRIEKGEMHSAMPRAGKIPTLIIAGQDGSHFWRGACEAMKQILENTGLFCVDFAFTPGWEGNMENFRPDFSAYDLVVINYGGKSWSQACQQDFEDYVSGGGGVVFLHSSIIPHEHWPAWNEMTGLGAWNQRDEQWGPYVYMQEGEVIYDERPGWAGYHGLQHRTLVEHHQLSHPIVAGLPPVWKHDKDEIYLDLRGPAKNLTLLATTHDRGKDYPVFWTVEWGKGRVFVDVQGHCGSDPEMIYSMTCAGFQLTFARGCEWAATGKVTQAVPADFPTEDTCSIRPLFRAP